MINKKITASILSFVTAASFLAVAVLPASAATLSVGASANVSGTSVKAQANAAARLPKIIAKSDTDISARITSLNNLSTRVEAMKNVSATEKTSLSNEIQTNITGLTTLKAKIDADTDVTVAATDAKSIFGSYRIYALVIPQGYIEASVDRVETITGLMTTISAKLQTRITAAQTAGKNVAPLQSALADLNAKVADANTQATTANTGVASLVPDQGNTTVAASNHAALVSARANIKTSTSDLQTARQDAKTIIQDLKAFNIKTSTTASTTVSQ